MSDIRLTDSIENLYGVGKYYQDKLKNLNIFVIKDLLWHFPFRYQDFTNIKPINELELDVPSTIIGHVEKIRSYRTYRRRMLLTEAKIVDETASADLVWFNQPFISNQIKNGSLITVSGKPKAKGKHFVFQSPAFEIISQNKDDEEVDIANLKHTGRLIPVYPETSGVSSKMLRTYIKRLLDSFQKQFIDYLPEETKKRNKLFNLEDALNKIHFPKNNDEAIDAKNRFVFEEMLLTQLHLLRIKDKMSKNKAPKIKSDINLIKEFLSTLPFILTNSQKKAIWDVMKDIETGSPMNRLLEGDVGSGKTIVAVSVALLCIKQGYQVAFMAPTEVLAKQHYQSIIKYLEPFKIKIALMTGDGVQIKDGFIEGKVTKEYLLKSIGDGTEWLVVGTHALIQKNIDFKNLGLVIIDEQHRFGIKQRKELLQKSNNLYDPNNPNSSPTPTIGWGGGQAELSEEKTNNNNKNKILEKDLSYKINGILFKIHDEIGRFCRERQYGDLLAKKLKENNINFQREVPIEIANIKSNFADFIIENKIIVELKTKPYIEKNDYSQILRYLKVKNIELGLLVNFTQKYLKPKRILNSEYSGHSDCSDCLDSVLLPHFLSMTATPIPRTLALSIYGDLDLSILDEMPKNRKTIITKIVPKIKEKPMFEFIRKEINNGRQVFVICPRIEESVQANEDGTKKVKNLFSFDQLLNYEVKAVKKEVEKMKKIFPEFKIEMLHGKMKSKDKELIMKKFYNNDINILVSTSVIEVGVDVPNASVMLIMGTESFGLAQLHQFRGRVGRGVYQSYCFLYTESNSRTTKERLEAMVDCHDGFKLAEIDLKLRGPGEMFGKNQSGFPDLAMTAIKDSKLLKNIQNEAKLLFATDPDFKKHPLFLQKYKEFVGKLHME